MLYIIVTHKKLKLSLFISQIQISIMSKQTPQYTELQESIASKTKLITKLDALIAIQEKELTILKRYIETIEVCIQRTIQEAKHANAFKWDILPVIITPLATVGMMYVVFKLVYDMTMSSMNPMHM
jgi:hypothetical protein